MIAWVCLLYLKHDLFSGNKDERQLIFEEHCCYVIKHIYKRICNQQNEVMIFLRKINVCTCYFKVLLCILYDLQIHVVML